MLTEREKQVLKLLCLTNSEIAQRLCITAITVKSHVRNIFNKLVCETSQKALIKALKLKIIDIDEVEG